MIYIVRWKLDGKVSYRFYQLLDSAYDACVSAEEQGAENIFISRIRREELDDLVRNHILEFFEGC